MASKTATRTTPTWWLPILHRAPVAIEASNRSRYDFWSDDLFVSYACLLSSTVNNSHIEVVLRGSEMYRQLMRTTTLGRTFFCTEELGFIGVDPALIEKGGQVVIFAGGKTPFAIRPTHNGRFRLLGEVYILGLMNGEFMTDVHSLDEYNLE